jgi:hypothetical protein
MGRPQRVLWSDSLFETMITRVPFVIHGGVRVADLQIGDFLDVRDTLGYWLIATVTECCELYICVYTWCMCVSTSSG